jgi:hypothetical protein
LATADEWLEGESAETICNSPSAGLDKEGDIRTGDRRARGSVHDRAMHLDRIALSVEREREQQQCKMEACPNHNATSPIGLTTWR